MTSGVSPLAGPARPAAAPAQTAERTKMQAVAKQFEAVFARQMIGAMRQTGLGDGAFDSSATDQFRDMADARTADALAETHGLGIADMLMRQYDAQHAAPVQAKAVTSDAVDSGG